MGWNYIVEVGEGDDLGALVAEAHNAHKERYPGVSREQAIADTPLVEVAAKAAVSFVEAVISPGEKFKVNVAGSSKHEEGQNEYVSVEVRKIIE